MANQTAQVAHWIGGQAAYGAEHGLQDIHDPATGEVAAQVGLGGGDTVAQAVAAARAAQPAWAAKSPLHRARVLNRFLALLEDNKETLARMISREHGKVISDARGEVMRGIEVVEFACGAPELMKGAMSINVGGGIDNWVQREPLGVVAGITPFNFPVMVPLWMMPMALATGNAFVLKPSPLDASPSLALAEMLGQAGLPAGVASVVQGGVQAVNALIDHPDVKAVSFVGSTAVARQIYERSAREGKRVQALGGAKNHLVVMPDADPEGAADALVGAAFGSAGERCMAISVAVFVGGAAEAVMPHILRKARALKVRRGMQEDAEMGAIVSAAARDRIAAYIASGVDEGASLLLDGREIAAADCGEGCGNGYWLGPTVFDRVQPSMRIYREEIFGPVLACVHVETLEQAIDLINGHDFANGVSLYTDSGTAARAFVQGIEVGMVGVNVPIPVPAAWQGFGGWKQSLFGDLHVYGEEGVRFYTRQKSVMQRWAAKAAGMSFAMPRSG
ncbi:CoA-acylating methylmalonate-semialdehyde dehydrogenase [Bordetella bronchiseptica]|uniref:methylmalonate-semialdehyde dehydrogenase (CoA acylating) n=1 Tax=Bordetella bronchiseptica (strain ATCC BAA-588 / NCTC 13252 / RB50) TaxID=257310 RepID=A0A0H3LNI7_BORBR|nr:CoA-acylating methylmalonate-semialdehyde dehydrogenase [Bordetella bronchiseptica]KAK61341.1 methylmalonate-semialdehyde dehydrogenase (acylating) [Bordetella bronchiseptica 980-2]AMG89122.1 methylmalonate-semialdehyde dehydrogenase (CoA acylating) [Bordetella bronchiseptica]AWP79845.1 methylmalonate-semialdehyde dehydrogenase (CoA acylating) [Bordetella bronchiseptica]KAB1442525.1 CoA-acylating methylmalonate-semialdehyde dehydrogenase [Bordetella bronchiseptica]KAB1568208.1 CoA-acylating